MSSITQMASGWQVNLTSGRWWKFDAQHVWAEENIAGDRYDDWDHIAPGVYWFRRQDDAMMFLMVWG